MARKKVSTTVYLTAEQAGRLAKLSEVTKVPVAQFIREGVDFVLEVNRGKLKEPSPAFGAAVS